MIHVQKISTENVHLLAPFFRRCQEVNIPNNASLKSIKFEKMQEPFGRLWMVQKASAVISMAGAHHLPEVGERCYRVLFRGATLPEYRNHFVGLNKYHMNSLPFSVLLPHIIAWCRCQKSESLVITTNVDYQGNRTSNTHRLMAQLEKKGLVRFVTRKEIFHTDQGVWELQESTYLSKVRDFYLRHQELFPMKFDQLLDSID